VSIRKPDPMPEDYLEEYWSNWWKVLTGRYPDTSLKARCVGCARRGVLGYDLVHRGATRPTNLLCDDCCEED
jgi:hypothetical protein